MAHFVRHRADGEANNARSSACGRAARSGSSTRATPVRSGAMSILVLLEIEAKDGSVDEMVRCPGGQPRRHPGAPGDARRHRAPRSGQAEHGAARRALGDSREDNDTYPPGGRARARSRRSATTRGRRASHPLLRRRRATLRRLGPVTGLRARRSAPTTAPRWRRAPTRRRRGRGRGERATGGRCQPRRARPSACPGGARALRSPSPASRSSRRSVEGDRRAGALSRAAGAARFAGTDPVRRRRRSDRSPGLPCGEAAGNATAWALVVDRQHVGHRALEEGAVVADDDDRAGPVLEDVLQDSERVEVEVVGRLVEQQHVRDVDAA